MEATPGLEWHVRFGPTKVLRQIGGMLQRQGAGKGRVTRHVEGAHVVAGPWSVFSLCTDDSYASSRGGVAAPTPGLLIVR